MAELTSWQGGEMHGPAGTLVPTWWQVGLTVLGRPGVVGRTSGDAGPYLERQQGS